MGGGSNLVVADDGYRRHGRAWSAPAGSRSRPTPAAAPGSTVAAGEPWDDVVARAVAEELGRHRGAVGHPGPTGATPIQNVGAYGQEVARRIARVRTFDRVDGVAAHLHRRRLRLRLPHQPFKAEPGRYVVLDVAFQLRLSADAPRRSATPSWRARSASRSAARAPLADVREAVLGLRRGKGMVLDAGRPRHLERRLVLHQPGPRRRGAPPPCRTTRPRYPAADGR